MFGETGNKCMAPNLTKELQDLREHMSKNFRAAPDTPIDMWAM